MPKDFRVTMLHRFLANRDGWNCKYCGKYLKDSDDITVDHVRPVSLGGDIDDPNNAVLSCRKCNSSKGNRR